MDLEIERVVELPQQGARNAPSSFHYSSSSVSGSTPICSAIFSRLLRVRLRSPR